MSGSAWQMTEPSAPLEVTELELQSPGPGQVLLSIQGCGICHTDLGFLMGGVRTKEPLPLTLGHEIVGTVVEAAPDANLEGGGKLEPGRSVIVPAVLPCGECALCRDGRDNVCQAQQMPGNDFHGGFASHITVAARFLVPVDGVPPDHSLGHLAVVADAVTTPYQALLRAGVTTGDSVIVIGTGGVGIYGVQLASVMGARVMAVDVDPERLDQAVNHGAAAGVSVAGLDEREARKRVQAEARTLNFPRHGWKVFEMSGTAGGQRLAYSLLTPAGTLGVVGYTRDKTELRLSNLMAFDADAFGSWGCSPRHYKTILDLLMAGKIQVKPFVTFFPLSEVNTVLERAHHGEFKTRPVLVPES